MSDDRLPCEIEPHCRNCRWWSHEPTTQVFGYCERASTMAGYSRVDERSLARASPDRNGEDTGADLWTDADFGCIQFQPIATAAEPG